MIEHQYDAEKALEILLKKIRNLDKHLALRVQEAIDAGKDVSEEDPTYDRRKKSRIYRKTLPFSHEEALLVAVDALQAFFVEQPLFVDSALDNLKMAAIGSPKDSNSLWDMDSKDKAPLTISGYGEEKFVEIEMQTETQLDKRGDECEPLNRILEAELERQKSKITVLRRLVNLREGR